MITAFLIAKKEKHCSSTGYIYTAFYSFTSLWSITQPQKRNEILTQATIQINLENIILNEGSQTQKATKCIIPLI